MQGLIAAGAPQMIVWLLDQDRASTLVLAGMRDGVARWRAADNVQIYTRDGMIIGTRGMAFDLMTIDADQAVPVITSGMTGQITRIHRQLDGQDRLKITSYVCDIVPAGSETIRTGETSYASTLRVDEQCYSPSGDLENRYWLHDGQILQSEQIFNRDVGRIRILFLH
ncbi:YjbF family lipoprotein [Paracoccus benzoatiresistens]|uniref:YjbF family lipoprotein n=1 Tax=Paracoccus benzoatiresistens TaxID=2997341 RepID=A0ABT4JB88_9RHOB|nr:YjbF family lipoprotein [Paracoccus sp. EF6]MCZ0964366.1 YjbF family lipoprotein [Paracoccus sp. EF6]